MGAKEYPVEAGPEMGQADVEVEEPGSGHVKPHANYVLVFIALAGITAVEVFVSQLPINRAPILIPLALIKVALVALFYMHLRSDNRLFSVLFVIGLFIASSLLIIFIVLLGSPTLGIMQPSQIYSP